MSRSSSRSSSRREEKISEFKESMSAGGIFEDSYEKTPQGITQFNSHVTDFNKKVN